MGQNRYAIHPEDFKSYGTEKIRQEFLMETIFRQDQIIHCYTHYDRLIVGGIAPVSLSLKLETIPDLRAEFFLQRREIGIINVGATGSITVDGKTYPMNTKDALYIGKDCKDVIFHPAKEGKALYYFNSAPAHAVYPTRKITFSEA